ncbi:unnamed protein product [Haemonchus placei]|uniref:F-box domain-containing protein n=1 Tax=Haemonchus placei TaxID=6290 RepID=A0A158QL17_HAEPC|nr:unnamed protein product [Haemonchus placei]
MRDAGKLLQEPLNDSEVCISSVKIFQFQIPNTFQKFLNWNEHEQLDIMERILSKMSHNQLFVMQRFIQPMLQRDFIALLPQHLAEMILSNLDARTLAACEAVSTSWRSVLARGQLWRKLIERNVRKDNMWRGLSEKKKWRKYILVSRDCAACAICDYYRHVLLCLFKVTFYRELFPKVVADIDKIESNWRKGVYKLSSINCRSENSKGVYCLQYDDEKIVSGLRDNVIKVWNRADLSCERVLSGHTGSVLCLQYDERVIISGDVYVIPCQVVLFSSKDRSIAVWDMVSPREINLRRVLVGHRAAVNVVDFDDRYIVSASGDRTIKVSESIDSLFTSFDLRGLTFLLILLEELVQHTGRVFRLQFDDFQIVSSSHDDTILIWDFLVEPDVPPSPPTTSTDPLLEPSMGSVAIPSSSTERTSGGGGDGPSPPGSPKLPIYAHPGPSTSYGALFEPFVDSDAVGTALRQYEVNLPTVSF